MLKILFLDQQLDDLDDRKFKLSVYENGYYLNTTDPTDDFYPIKNFIQI